jgi:hypothetical protein
MQGAVRLGAWLLLGLLAFSGCSPAPNQAGATSAEGVPDKEQPIPADLKPLVERSIQIGVQIYLLDKAAAIGTDVLLANVKDPETKNLGGYLPFREGDDAGKPLDSYRVSFFTTESPPRIAYEIQVPLTGKPRFEAFEPPRVSPQGFADLVRARQAALAHVSGTQPMNPVLIPADAYGQAGTLVYLIAGTKQPNVAVFGKHYVALVAPGASQVSSIKPFTNTALEVPIVQPKGGEKLEALLVSQILTDYPPETHVFTSLLIRLPLLVLTKRGVWRVDGDKVAYLGKR